MLREIEAAEYQSRARSQQAPIVRPMTPTTGVSMDLARYVLDAVVLEGRSL